MPIYLIQHREFSRDAPISSASFENIFKESFHQVNEQFKRKARQESIRSGSTCCISILSANGETNSDAFTDLNIAWCGDTRLCLVSNGQIVFMSDEHKPENELEKERILSAGGDVSFVSNAWRINSSLAVSRSFGNLFLIIK